MSCLKSSELTINFMLFMLYAVLKISEYFNGFDLILCVIFQGHPGEEGPKGIQGIQVRSTFAQEECFPVFLFHYCFVAFMFEFGGVIQGKHGVRISKEQNQSSMLILQE